jgi:hypothetical protein
MNHPTERDVDDLFERLTTAATFASRVSALFEKIARDIKKCGVSLISVPDAGPPFTYTIGLSESSLGREIIVFALDPMTAGVILNHVAESVREGAVIEPGVPDDRWANMPCVFRHVTGDNAEKYCGAARGYYDKPVRLLQLVIPDREGRFPWDDDYDLAYMGPLQRELYATPDDDERAAAIDAIFESLLSAQRDRFEASMRENSHAVSLARQGDDYECPDAQVAWIGWLAAWRDSKLEELGR